MLSDTSSSALTEFLSALESRLASLLSCPCFHLTSLLLCHLPPLIPSLYTCPTLSRHREHQCLLYNPLPRKPACYMEIHLSLYPNSKKASQNQGQKTGSEMMKGSRIMSESLRQNHRTIEWFPEMVDGKILWQISQKDSGMSRGKNAGV